MSNNKRISLITVKKFLSKYDLNLKLPEHICDVKIPDMDYEFIGALRDDEYGYTYYAFEGEFDEIVDGHNFHNFIRVLFSENDIHQMLKYSISHGREAPAGIVRCYEEDELQNFNYDY